MVARDRWLDAQVGVLGSVLLKPELAARLITDTSASDFSEDFRAIYGAICALVTSGEAVDAMTIRNRLGPASTELLRQIVTLTPTAANYEPYVAACREQSRLRSLNSLSAELAGAVTLDDARAILGKMQGVTVEHNVHRVTALMDGLSEFFWRGSDLRSYVEWGLPALDDKVYTAPGDVIVLGGYASDGKSAFMLQAALHMAKAHKVGIFSFEGTHAKTIDRIVAHTAKVQLSAIRRGGLPIDVWQQITSKTNALSKLQLEIVEASGMNVSDVIGMTLSRGYEIIFLDYIQLIQSDSSRRTGTRQEELAEISKTLAVASRQHKLMIVELSQLSRPPRQKDGSFPAPTLSSLQESGQLEQDADVVLLLYRKTKDAQDVPRELFVAKNKEGSLGLIPLHFDGPTQTFYRTTHEEIDRVSAKRRREDRDANQLDLGDLQDAGPDVPFTPGGDAGA